MVGLNSEFMASGLILSIPWDDHFTKSTLQRQTTKRITQAATGEHRQQMTASSEGEDQRDRLLEAEPGKSWRSRSLLFKPQDGLQLPQQAQSS